MNTTDYQKRNKQNKEKLNKLSYLLQKNLVIDFWGSFMSEEMTSKWVECDSTTDSTFGKDNRRKIYGVADLNKSEKEVANEGETKKIYTEKNSTLNEYSFVTNEVCEEDWEEPLPNQEHQAQREKERAKLLRKKKI